MKTDHGKVLECGMLKKCYAVAVADGCYTAKLKLSVADDRIVANPAIVHGVRRVWAWIAACNTGNA